MDAAVCSLWKNITIATGTKADYGVLAHLHYRAGAPIGVTRVLVARWDGRQDGQVIAALVETRPVLNCALRQLALPGRFTGSKTQMAHAINQQLRTIARVVVDPRFRGIGLAEALVRHCLATSPAPCVEALASMGRTQPFFENAGMRRYDRPMPAESVRLLAALHHEGICAGDLEELSPRQVNRFLAYEFYRFWRSGRHSRGRHADSQGIPRAPCRISEMLADARRRLLSWPAYYLWQRPGADLSPPASPPACRQMPEALTVFLSAADKARIVTALKQTHPDLALALRTWAQSRVKAKNSKLPAADAW